MRIPFLKDKEKQGRKNPRKATTLGPKRSDEERIRWKILVQGKVSGKITFKLFLRDKYNHH